MKHRLLVFALLLALLTGWALAQQPPARHVAVSVETWSAIADYLASRPYKEVAPLFERLKADPPRGVVLEEEPAE